MLTNVRVLDLTRVLAGPLCTMTLGDLGANVIKVERTGSGDESRTWGPPFDTRGESAYFLSINRNKLSLEIDFSLEADRAVLLELVAGADVVVDNFRAGVLARSGIDAERLLTEHPSLIWCTISGFGAQSSRPGYDFVVQAEGGWMAITGDPAGPPTKTGVALADVIAGKDAAIAILAALAARATGTQFERRLHISLAATTTAALVNVAQNFLVGGKDAARWGNAHPNLVPYQLFEAQDRHVVIAVGSDAQWRACARALDLEHLATDPDLATNAGRVTRREAVVSAIADRVRNRPARDWIAALSAADVPCGIVRTVREALADVPDASPLTGMPPSVPGSVRFPPPRLGAHNDAIRRHGWNTFVT